MYISQISGLNSPNYIRTQKKSVKNSGNISFESAYTTAFNKAFTKEFRHVNPEVCNMFVDLFSKLKSHPGVAVNSILDSLLGSHFEDMDSLFQNIYSGNPNKSVLSGNGIVLATNSHSDEPLAWLIKLDDEIHLGISHPNGKKSIRLCKYDNADSHDLIAYSLCREFFPYSYEMINYDGNNMKEQVLRKKWFGELGM